MGEARQQPSAVRRHADIERGLTGDKKAGFDPAAAPLETDSEAGGAMMTPEAASPDDGSARTRNPSDWQGTRATAMRSFDDEPRGSGGRFWRIAAAVAAAVVLVLAGILALVSWQA